MGQVEDRWQLFIFYRLLLVSFFFYYQMRQMECNFNIVVVNISMFRWKFQICNLLLLLFLLLLLHLQHNVAVCAAQRKHSQNVNDVMSRHFASISTLNQIFAQLIFSVCFGLCDILCIDVCRPQFGRKDSRFHSLSHAHAHSLRLLPTSSFRTV